MQICKFLVICGPDLKCAEQFMDQASSYLATNDMDGEYSTTGQGRAGLALQGNVMQSRAGQGLQVQSSIYIAVSQKRLTV